MEVSIASIRAPSHLYFQGANRFGHQEQEVRSDLHSLTTIHCELLVWVLRSSIPFKKNVRLGRACDVEVDYLLPLFMLMDIDGH